MGAYEAGLQLAEELGYIQKEIQPMKQKVLEKMATEDAQRWAAAEMFYGEGAGTKRKLLEAELASKVENVSGYHEKFEQVYNGLDMNKYAQLAIKERKALDRAAKVHKNVRALKSGNLNNLSTGVFVVVGVAVVLHQTGYDKKIEKEAKKMYTKAKTEIKLRRLRAQGRNVEKLIP